MYIFFNIHLFIFISIHLKTANALQQTPQREILMGTWRLPSTPPQHNCVKPCYSSPLTATKATALENKTFEVADSKTCNVVLASSLNTLISSQFSGMHSSSGQQINLNIEAATPTTPNATPIKSSTPLQTHSTPSSTPLATV